MKLISNYSQFVLGENLQDIESQYHSLGEYIEEVAKGNDYLMGVVISKYTQDIDPQISLSNAINLLPKSEKKSLLTQVENHLSGKPQSQTAKVVSNTILESEAIAAGQPAPIVAQPETPQEQIGGKSLLASFMKCLTALGQKNNAPAQEICPGDFLIFYDFKNLDSKMLQSIFGRFKALSLFNKLIDYDKNQTQLYFGIKCDANFEYGVRSEEGTLKPIGRFKLNKSAINSVLNLQSLSAQSIKKELVNLSTKEIEILGKAKLEMAKYKPGYFDEILVPILKDKTLTFGYRGIGKWSDGQLDPEQLETVRDGFKKFLSKFRWCDQVRVSVSPQSFWIYFYIKVK